jgi:hypothetical protein
MKYEDPATTAVEEQTRKVPSLFFLGLAAAAVGISALLTFSGGPRRLLGPRRDIGLLIAQWVPAILVLGTYNKIAKTFSPPDSRYQQLQHGGNRAGAEPEGIYRSEQATTAEPPRGVGPR